MAQERVSLILRLPVAVKQQLDSQARNNDRTSNAEAARLIRQGLERNAPVAERA